MNTLDPTSAEVSRVLLVEPGGATGEVLLPLAASGIMPNLAGLSEKAALARLRSDGPCSESVARRTLQAGGGPGVHGVLDDCYLDHHRRWILPGHTRPPPCPTLADLVTAADREAPAVQVADLTSAARYPAPIWEHKPADFRQLASGIARTETAVRDAVAAARRIDRSVTWRLLHVRLAVFDSLLGHLWHLLGIGGGPGGNRQWVAKTRQAFRTLDDCLGELLELASRRDAAAVLLSPYGFSPFREKITLSELLRRRDLLQVAGGTAKLGYRTSRLAWKARRWFAPADPFSRPVGGLLPIDWRRTRAVTLHGQSAALVYLNTPERFGNRALTTLRQREQAAAEATAALGDARHPITREPLFDDVYLTEERFGGDPLARFWPEVVAIPRAGFHTRHRLDRNRHLLRSRCGLAAVRSGEGMLMLHAPGAAPGKSCTAELADVAPTILNLLGLEPGAAMTGRVIEELFVSGQLAAEKETGTFSAQHARGRSGKRFRSSSVTS